LNKCKEIAHKISNNSPRAISAAIMAINAGYSHAQMGMEREQKEFGLCFGTTDFREGTTAFLEKRKPAFTGK
jgi:enoyl-CoA hydratase